MLWRPSHKERRRLRLALLMSLLLQPSLSASSSSPSPPPPRTLLRKRAPPLPPAFPRTLFGHSAVVVPRPPGWRARGDGADAGGGNSDTGRPTQLPISVPPEEPTPASSAPPSDASQTAAPGTAASPSTSPPPPASATSASGAPAAAPSSSSPPPSPSPPPPPSSSPETAATPAPAPESSVPGAVFPAVTADESSIALAVGGWPWLANGLGITYGWALDLDTMRVANITFDLTAPEFPDQRTKHVAASLGGSMVLHGGYHLTATGDPVKDDTWVMDFGGPAWGRWRRLQFTTPVPRARWSHAACVSGNTMYIHGGRNNTSTLDDLWALRADPGADPQWRPVRTTGSVPPPRMSHAMVAQGGRIYLFGGTADGVRPLDPLYVLDLESLEWESVLGPAEGGRWGLTAVVAEGNVLFVGGVAGNPPAITGDILQLDQHTGAFSRLAVAGQDLEVATPRKEHATVAYGSWVVSLGGIVDPAPTAQWKRRRRRRQLQPQQQGALPPSAPRNASAGPVLPVRSASFQVLDMSTQAFVSSGIHNATVGEPFANGTLVPVSIRGFGFGGGGGGAAAAAAAAAALTTATLSGLGLGPGASSSASAHTRAQCLPARVTPELIYCVADYIPAGYFTAEVSTSPAYAPLNRSSTTRATFFACPAGADVCEGGETGGGGGGGGGGGAAAAAGGGKPGLSAGAVVGVVAAAAAALAIAGSLLAKVARHGYRIRLADSETGRAPGGEPGPRRRAG